MLPLCTKLCTYFCLSSLTLFWSDTRHCALIRMRVTPAWPYLALVCSGVSPYWKIKIWLIIFAFLVFYMIIYFLCLFIPGLGSSVGIATDYGLDGPGIESQWGRDFPHVQTGPGAHPASCSMGTGSFPGVKVWLGHAADHSPPSSVLVLAFYVLEE
jgi:hypothetical protein